jgi:hypothetical protein
MPRKALRLALGSAGCHLDPFPLIRGSIPILDPTYSSRDSRLPAWSPRIAMGAVAARVSVVPSRYYFYTNFLLDVSSSHHVLYSIFYPSRSLSCGYTNTVILACALSLMWLRKYTGEILKKIMIPYSSLKILKFFISPYL